MLLVAISIFSPGISDWVCWGHGTFPGPITTSRSYTPYMADKEASIWQPQNHAQWKQVRSSSVLNICQPSRLNRDGKP